MVVEAGGLRNPSPCARLAVARPRPLSSEFSPGAGAQSSQAAPGAGPAETGCRGEHPAGRRAGGREQPQEGCPRPPAPADARHGPVSAPRKARGAGRAGPPSRDAREAAGGARGARARAKLGREAPLPTGSCERSQHGVSQRAASAGLPGAAGPANGKHIGATLR
ncbi:translation initiation factor IF-2-like [Cervus elaphus]|uniref:translation initiation factor IF-2-like n=1 Tax=Cervus elaphus TaxID=9860 RepID=UPI001CC2BF50|nr:translation initiation factor IF-2-like [Cervus elaphus]